MLATNIMKNIENFKPSIDEMMSCEDLNDLINSICANFAVERPTKAEARDSDLMVSFRAMCSLFTQVVSYSKEQRIYAMRLEKRLEVLERELRASRNNQLMRDSRVEIDLTPKILNNVVNTVIADLKDRQEREKHIVIFGIDKPQETMGENWAEKDKERVKDVLSKVGIAPENVIRIRRLYSKNPTIIVELPNKETRNEAVRRSKLLRDKGPLYDKIFIKPDLTPAEQLERKELFVTMNRLNTMLEEKKKSGKTIKYRYVVRNGKVQKWFARPEDEAKMTLTDDVF